MNKKDVFQEQKFLKEYYDLLKKSYIGLSEKILSYRKENKIKPLGDKLAYAQALAIFSILNPNIDLQKMNLNDFGFLTDGSDDCSFDLINIDENKNIIEIFDFKRGNDGFSLNDLRILDGNIRDYIFNRITYEELDNTLLKVQLEKIKLLVDKNLDTKIKIYLFREKNSTPDTTFLKKVESMKLEYKDKGLEIILVNKNDILDLVNNNLYNNLSVKNDDTLLEIKVFNKIIKDNVIIGIISLFDLIQFIQEAKEKGIQDLYKLNVRKDLKNPELISNITRTIINTPENFLYFHNGITIIVKNIDIYGDNIKLVEPQIINGCQSTSAIYNSFIHIINENRKLKNNKFDLLDIGKIEDFEGLDLATYINDNYKQIEALKKSNIQIKILSVSNNEELLIEKISEYSNKQISIEGFELRSNDLFNKIIENYVSKYGFYYNRKKTNDKNFKKDITIKIDDLFQILYSIFSKDPQGAKNVKKKIFQLNNSDNSYLSLLNKVDLKLILKIFLINKSFYKLNMDEAWRYYYILAFILIEEKESFNVLEKDFDYILKKGKEISDFILKIKSNDYYKKKDIFRNYGSEIWNKIYNYINGEKKNIEIEKRNIEFNKELFIKKLRELGGKGSLILSLKGSFIKINDSVLNIKFRTQFAYNVVNTIENQNILKKGLEEVGFENLDINLIK